MNKWVCFGGEAPHVQIDGGSRSLGSLCWRMMQCERSPWQPRTLAYTVSLHNACSCHQCVAMQTSPAATVKFRVEEVWNPSRLKGEGGTISREGGGGEVSGQTGDSHHHTPWFVPLVHNTKSCNTKVLLFFYYSIQHAGCFYSLGAWCYLELHE